MTPVRSLVIVADSTDVKTAVSVSAQEKLLEKKSPEIGGQERGESMTTKEWLMRAWRIDREIDTLLEAKQKAFDRCVSTTVRPKEITVSGGGGANPMVEYVHLEEKIDERVDELHRIKCETLDVINKVQDSTLRTLLIERYINFKTWERIAVDMGYSWRQVIRLHGKALQVVKMS